ncbi:MAG TPA: type VI secretion system tube protein Hcp [Flavobacteriales bacterium]|nr:type VI secretion system tube protein Hcp [Flavobacteriales bacterium]
MRTTAHFLGAALLSCFMLSPSGASAQGLKYYVQWTAPAGMTLRGSVIQKGREGWTQGYSLSHEILLPRDATGNATGKLQHKPMTMVIDLDAATTSLLTILAQNGTIPSVSINCFKTATSGGVETLYYEINLTDVTIGSIQTAIGPGVPNSQFDSADMPSGIISPDMIRATLYYKRITTTWKSGNATFQGGM